MSLQSPFQNKPRMDIIALPPFILRDITRLLPPTTLATFAQTCATAHRYAGAQLIGYKWKEMKVLLSQASMAGFQTFLHDAKQIDDLESVVLRIGADLSDYSQGTLSRVLPSVRSLHVQFQMPQGAVKRFDSTNLLSDLSIVFPGVKHLIIDIPKDEGNGGVEPGFEPGKLTGPASVCGWVLKELEVRGKLPGTMFHYLLTTGAVGNVTKLTLILKGAAEVEVFECRESRPERDLSLSL